LSLRRLYALVGAAWGLLLGAGAAFGMVAFALGASWLFLFGDDPWPEAVGPVVFGVGLLAGLLVLALGVWAGHRLGSRYESAPREAQDVARRRGVTLLWGWGATVAALVALSTISALRYNSERETAAEQERQFTALVQVRHRIGSVKATTDVGGGTRVATIYLRGDRAGAYRLDWTLDERTYRTVLDEGSRQLSLPEGEESVELRFDLATLRERYRDRVLSGEGGVLVEEDFQLHLMLTPQLTEAERRSIPGREVHNLELGDSQLIAEVVGAVPVRFVIR
jgi:hypothetical protein